MHRFAVPLVLATAFLAFNAAYGADSAIKITGKVLDENGAPVRDVRITATHSGSAAPVTAGSDAAGIFTLEIPAAGAYRIQAEHEGYFLFSQSAIGLDETSGLEIQLTHLKELAESVNVNYSPPVIDPHQTSDTKSLNNQEILNIPYPASQDYRNALPLMTGAILDNAGQVHLNGGNTQQANYRLNGFDISDPATGMLNARLNVDTVQTLEWDASRFTADKGKGSAGTLDIKTQMGDDHWRFGSTNFIPSLSSEDGWHINHWSPRVIVSGPIRKGKAWFHNSFDTYYVVSTISGLPRGRDQTRSFIGSDLMRLQWNISRTHILTANFLANIGSDKNDGLSFLIPSATTVNRRTALFMGTVRDQWSVGGGLIEFGYAQSATYLRSTPQVGNLPYVITPFGAQGNYYSNQTTSTGRQEGLVNAFVRPIKAAGTHQLEIGVDTEHSDLDQTVERNSYTTVGLNNAILRTVQFLGDPQRFKNDNEAYAYALDRWSPNDTLVIEGGLRSQWNQYAGAAPIAPRIAASWSPKWADGAKFSAGWGIFYDAITLDMLAVSQEQSAISTYYSPTGAVSGVPITTQFQLNPHDLRLPRFALTSFAAEKKLPWQVYAKVNLISREGSRGFTFQDVINSALNVYVLDNVQRQRYRAAEFAFRRTFMAKYQWFASYTRSEARANAVINYTIDNPLFAPQAGGPLPWDAPNRVLAWAWAPVEKKWFPGFLQSIVGETNLQILVDYHTGFPFSVMNEIGNLVGLPDSRRFPAFGTLNLALERQFPFRGYLWAGRVSLINVLDRSNPNVVNSDINSPQFLMYQRGQARAFNVRLRFLGRK